MILKIVKIFTYAKRPGSQLCSTGDGVGRIVHLTAKLPWDIHDTNFFCLSGILVSANAN